MTFDLPTLVELIALGLFAGWLGALVGIGGGVVVVPSLVLLFGVDIRVAVASSLVAVIATSAAAVSVYANSGLTNFRLGMSLEIATALGAIGGSLIAVWIPTAALSVIFGVLLMVTTALLLRAKDRRQTTEPLADPASDGGGWEVSGRLAGGFHDARTGSVVTYQAVRAPLGAAISMGAGVASGMLGVGGGFIKVPAMNLGMRVPIKVAAATSNFMIGVTAVSSVFVYLARGLVEPLLVAPLVVGIVAGALFGTRTSKMVSATMLRRVLAVLLVFVSIEMLARGLGVGLGI